MTWSLSQFRAGDLVEIRSKEEILATLDQDGCFEGMPFMPEMLQFCGKQFRVGAVAHKTCDTVRKTGGRRLQHSVHLDGVRCLGSAHGGCQAACNLFWKDAWLRPAVDGRFSKGLPTHEAKLPVEGCGEDRLVANTRLYSALESRETFFSCQATKLYEATEPLAWWDVRQYVYDVMTGNHSVAEVLRVLWLASLRWLVMHAPFGYRLINCCNDWIHVQLTGRASPSVYGKIERGEPTPIGRLDLKAGEYVRIKSKNAIEQTLGENGRNRGLTFDPEEMAPYCDRVFKVRSSVSKIIDEKTGQMLHMKQPCIILEGVVCNAEYARFRLNCPRAIYSYWREIWLERAH
jgi:hypothetical protein